MRAVVWTRYGSPEGLELTEVPKPCPRAGELLVRIRATTVTAGDCELRALRLSLEVRILVRLLMGFRQPRRRILGQEWAGEVEAVGSAVTAFRVGDRVFGTTGFGFGAYAEYLCVPERARGRALAAIPGTLDFDEAAAAPTGGLEALHFLRAAGDLAGRQVLIVGGGGGIGTFAIQLAKRSGADLTAVDGPSKLELMHRLGARRVIDFTREDVPGYDERYDVILDIVGGRSFSSRLRRLRKGGVYLAANPGFRTRFRAACALRRGGRRVLARPSAQSSADLRLLAQMLETGQLRSVIDRRFPIELVQEAHRYVDSGMVRGKVVLRVG